MVNVNYSNANSQYNRQSPDIQVDYSALSMNELIQSSGEVGTLIPVMFRELLPGQSINVRQQVGVQFTPFVTNMFTPFEGRVMTYFVPTRLALPDVWEMFITGGATGVPSPDVKLPTVTKQSMMQFVDSNGSLCWLPGAALKPDSNPNPDLFSKNVPLAESLWDYFGLPCHTLPIGKGVASIDPDTMPLDIMFRVYNMVWNEVLRFPDISPDKRPLTDMSVQRWYWANDYFTRSRIYQMRGEMPTIPVSGLENSTISGVQSLNPRLIANGIPGESDFTLLGDKYAHTESRKLLFSASKPGTGDPTGQLSVSAILDDVDFSRARIDLSDPSIGVTINDFLLALAVGRVEFNDAKIIPRYIDHLRDRWSEDPQDYRLQLPEFVSTWTFGVKTNSIVQTSGAPFESVKNNEQSPLGSVMCLPTANPDAQGVNYKAHEHGYIISLLCIRPVATYEGGMSRFFRRKTRFDFATPELVNTPDVQNFQEELLWDSSSEENNKKPFGWMGIYDEYRTSFGRVTGILRPSLSKQFSGLGSYTLARFWDSGSSPQLNEEFCLCRPDMDRIKVYPNQPDFIMYFTNDFNTAIPIPFESDPAIFANL